MRHIFLLLFTLCYISPSFSQDLYVQTFGDSLDQPVLFLHGGPGYNSASFEGTTAENLANEGFYVVIYDRRGEGRSQDNEAAYTFTESIKDLNYISDSLHLDSLIILGHSFGGMLGIKYCLKFPQKTKALVLVGAPVSLQESFKTILKSSRSIYEQNKDNTNIKYLDMLESMDTASLAYSSYCFMHAMQNDFYSPDSLTDAAFKLYAQLNSNKDLKEYAQKMDQDAPSGFWKNEQYTTMNLSKNLKKLKKKNKVLVYGLYGENDGLYSSQQIKHLESLIGNDNVILLENCSHSVFIDQQSTFISSLKHWFK